MNSNAKIILPGGAGLVGQNLIIHLKNRGYRNLVVLDKHQKNLNILRKLHPDIVAEYADVAEPGAWEQHFEGADIVIMLQAQIGGRTIEPFIRNNITSTKIILDVIKRCKVPYLVHVSSSVVESAAQDYYSDTKREQEKIVLESGVQSVILRPTLMFGWFDRKHLGWLSRFMKRVPVFPIPGDGKYIRQPMYVGDFCNIIVSCVEKRITGQVFNITGLAQIYYVDIIRSIKKATKANALIIPIPYKAFHSLLRMWSIFDANPPFTAEQLEALVARDEFEVINWPAIFDVVPTDLDSAIEQTFTHPVYSKIILEF